MTSTEEVTKMIGGFQNKFYVLQISVTECLKKHKMPVSEVAGVLATLSLDKNNRYKMFPESHVSVLFKAVDIPEVFKTMRPYWDYLNPGILGYVVDKLDLKEAKLQMETYKSDLRRFRMKIPLSLFCQVHERSVYPTVGFPEMVAKCDWPGNVILEVVEQFRQEIASHYHLRECAVIFAKVGLDSFVVTWIVPALIKELIEVPKAIVHDYSRDCVEYSVTIYTVLITRVFSPVVIFIR